MYEHTTLGNPFSNAEGLVGQGAEVACLSGKKKDVRARVC